jgi:hypothetical protein
MGNGIVFPGYLSRREIAEISQIRQCTVPIVELQGGNRRISQIRHMYCSYRSTTQRSSTARRRRPFLLRIRNIISSGNHGDNTLVTRKTESLCIDFGRNTWHGTALTQTRS